MTLAIENIVQIGPERITLRPTLRAAIRLDREHGLRALVVGITDGSLSVMSDVLRESVDPSQFDADLLLEIGPAGLGIKLASLIEPLLAHVFALYGLDPDDKQTETQTKPAPVDPAGPTDPFAELFAIATGVLGWSPAQAYAASPAEIIAAHEGRVRFVDAILRAVIPVENAEGESLPDRPETAKFDRDALSDLRAMMGAG